MSKLARRETFLPQAPGRNMSAVTRDFVIPGKDLLGATGKPLSPYLVGAAEEKLAKFREEYHAATYVPVGEIAGFEVNSRDELILEAAALFSEFAVPQTEDKATMVHASLAGCGVVMAFLELSARFHAKEGLSVADDDRYKGMINKSQVTLLDLAATSREADGVFMTNACTWSRSEIERMSDEAINAGLRFDDAYFTMSGRDVVAIRNDPETRKRAGRRGGHDFDFSSCGREVLFGCPARSRIGPLFKSMFEAALRNHLLEELV